MSKRPPQTQADAGLPSASVGSLRYLTTVERVSRFRWRWTVSVERRGAVTAVHDGLALTERRARRAVRGFMQTHSHEEFRLAT